jgi:hypothetical protein
MALRSNAATEAISFYQAISSHAQIASAVKIAG